MKKNITINLCGALYAIDEDACQLLEQYLDNMRSYFSKREGGDEIADDVEHRVAELFSELRAQGHEALNIDDVQAIIQRIGNPEQMDELNEGDESSSEHNHASTQGTGACPPPPFANSNDLEQKAKSWFAQRKFYRDPEDKMLGGVMSGLCHYFGGSDPLPWRIIMVVLAFVSFSTIAILYLIAWAIVPPATTAEERLRMRGQAVNPQTLTEDLLRQKPQGTPSHRSGARSFVQTLLSIFVFCAKLFCLIVLGFAVFAFVMFIIVLVCWGIGVSAGADDDVLRVLSENNYLFWVMGGAALTGLTCFSCLLYLVVRSLLNIGNNNSSSSRTNITLLVVCLLTAVSSIGLGIYSALAYTKCSDNIERRENTIGGIFIEQPSRAAFARGGWTLLTAKNCNGQGKYDSSTDDFGTEEVYYSFRKINEHRAMEFNMCKHANLPAGQYHFEILSDVSGYGAYVYCNEAKFDVVSRNKDDKGNLWAMPFEQIKALRLFTDSVSATQWHDERRDDVEHWSYQRTPSFTHKGGPLLYGFAGNMQSGASKARLLRLNIVADNAE